MVLLAAGLPGAAARGLGAVFPDTGELDLAGAFAGALEGGFEGAFEEAFRGDFKGGVALDFDAAVDVF